MNSSFSRPACDDLAADRVGERDVGADVEAEPHVRPLGARASAAGRPRSSRAPLRTPRRRWWKKIGCVSRALLPHRTIRSVSSASRYELVPPPAPNTVARPATLGACQVRLQLSMLLLPSTTLANFWAAKLTSLVAFEHEKTPKVVRAVRGLRRREAVDDLLEGLVPARGAQRCVLRSRGREAGSAARSSSARSVPPAVRMTPRVYAGRVGRCRTWPNSHRGTVGRGRTLRPEVGMLTGGRSSR